MKKKQVIFVLLIIGIIIILALIIYAVLQSKKDDEENKKAEYVEYTIERDDLVQIITSRGNIEAFNKTVYIIKKSEYYSINVKSNNFYDENTVIYTLGEVEIKSETYGYVESIKENDEDIVITLVHMDSMRARLFIPIEESFHINLSTKIDVYFNNPLIKYAAVITWMDYKYTVIDNEILLAVDIEIKNNKKNLLLINTPITANFYIGDLKGVLIIPELYLAYVYNNEKLIGTVFTINNNQIIERDIILGVYYQGKYQIISGLQEGDIVILK